MALSSPAAFIFSHPNHELAVYGLVQRLNPWIIFLTDGGGADRIEQTRQGLSRIGRLDRAVFLDHPERDFYARLLSRDVSYFKAIAGQVNTFLREHQPACVCSDAIEFYNPVHDLAVPITHAALAGVTGCKHYEVPLVHQGPVSGDTSNYVVQRLPESLGAISQVTVLTQPELEAKRAARDEVYTLLSAQLGATLTDLSLDHLGREVVSPAPVRGMREPGNDYVLRYEWRAKKLQKDGVIDEIITLDDHFRPIVDGLLARVT